METKKQDPFISQNVWLKRLGLCILIVCMFPSLLTNHEFGVVLIFKLVIFFAAVAYLIKLVKGFFKSLFNS
jgi:hypothetical protein